MTNDEMLKIQDAMLRKAQAAHAKRKGHKKVWVGANFVQCDICQAHAHVSGVKLIAHDSREYKEILPEYF